MLTLEGIGHIIELKQMEVTMVEILNPDDVHYKRVKGLLASHVARGEGHPETVAKSIVTQVEKFKLSLPRLVEEVGRETVEVYGNAAYLTRQVPERRARFEKLKVLLSR